MSEEYSGKLDYDGEPGGAERRRAPRVEKTLDLTYRVKSLPDEKTLIETLDKLLTAQSRDVSAVGISMWTGKLMTPGTTIEMDLAAPAGDEALTVTARVVWCQPHTEGGYVRSQIGLEFLNVSTEVQEKIKELAGG